MWLLMITLMKTEHMITLKVNHMKAEMLMHTATITVMATEVIQVTSKVLSATQKILFIAPRGQKRSTCTTPYST